jgi:hypothetical protein
LHQYKRIINNFKYKFELKPNYVIANIRKKSAAEKCGLKVGDEIISIGGIDATKKLISGILLQLKYNYNFRYETTPYYLFETSTEDSDCNSHNKFIKMLETESVKFNPKIFIKTDFVGKISAN